MTKQELIEASQGAARRMHLHIDCQYTTRQEMKNCLLKADMYLRTIRIHPSATPEAIKPLESVREAIKREMERR